MNDNNEGPERSVSWADTVAFREAFGDSEAEKQRKEFDRASWARNQPDVNPLLDKTTRGAELTDEVAGKLVLLWLGSIVVTAGVTYYIMK